MANYYQAAADDDGAAACSLLYSLFAESTPEVYGTGAGPPVLQGSTCPQVMTKLFRQLPGQPPSVLRTTRVAAVRVMGRGGVVELHSSAVPAGEISVERERGAWKIGSLIGLAKSGLASQAWPSDSPRKVEVERGGRDANDGDDDPGSHDDEPIVDYGHAASSSDKRAIVSLIRADYAAAAAADGKKLCAYLYGLIVEGVPEEYESSTGAKGRSCGELLSKGFSSKRHLFAAQMGKLRITRVRVDGQKGLAMLYVGKPSELYLRVHREGSMWKMASQLPVGLP